MSKTITDLREALFDTLEKLKSGDLTVEQAKAISGVAQTIVNTAKVENDYLNATGQRDGSGFIGDAPQETLPKGVTKIAKWGGGEC